LHIDLFSTDALIDMLARLTASPESHVMNAAFVLAGHWQE
jgi:hypothetical protein